eukprot:CAMPEP_0115283458 /NCGR_PEP_ID=MMETSP0270-20121206/60386_1 /TAXON_ID=71861 /ORGANISM="Scrippsiella trochoidea, Strain CCMP3099" /LENGTH=190 /DNA_ID=CAMNT_0002700371 /DNA_START=238 /DNA_END=807 /DNA_ORIENTATION=-
MRRVIATLYLLHLAACRVLDLNFLKTAETEDPSCPYLITSNPYSYVCDAQTVANTPSDHLACLQPDPETAGTLSCPGNTTISCFIFASFGDVSGSCAECEQSVGCRACETCMWKDRCSYSTGGCFNNCVDCWGEGCYLKDPTTPLCAAYFPESWGEACIGHHTCYMGYVDTGHSKIWHNIDDSERIAFWD